MTAIIIALWLNKDLPVIHGYSPATDEDRARLRIGPFVIAWELGEL